MTGTFLYFAYGSNLLKQRLLLRNPTARRVGIARLDDHCTAWDYFLSAEDSIPWKGAGITIRQRPGGTVWGLVWEIDMADSDTLTGQEVGYFIREVSVTTEDGNVLTCRTYELEGEYHVDHTPSPQYKAVIVLGATQAGLPPEYIENLRAVPDNGYQGDIEIYNTVMRELQREKEAS